MINYNSKIGSEILNNNILLFDFLFLRLALYKVKGDNEDRYATISKSSNLLNSPKICINYFKSSF